MLRTKTYTYFLYIKILYKIFIYIKGRSKILKIKYVILLTSQHILLLMLK